MDIQINAVEGVTITSTSIRIISVGSDLGVYWAEQRVNRDAEPQFQTVLTAVKIGASRPLSPPQIVVPQLLPDHPSWDLTLATGGNGTLATTHFGGGWNALHVHSLTNGQLAPGTHIPWRTAPPSTS